MNCVILAGGRGTRLIPEKGLLSFGRHTLIEHIIERLSPIFKNFHLVVNSEEPYRKLGIPLIQDLFPGRGPLGGIYSGLSAIGSHSFFCACDMPFINCRLVAYMKEMFCGFDAVIPEFRGNYEPLHALYAPSCIEPMKLRLDQGHSRIISFLDLVQVYPVRHEVDEFDHEGRTFFNINTPQDYEDALRMRKEEELQ
jgi:molybdenum cofactor guanylyltransferase